MGVQAAVGAFAAVLGSTVGVEADHPGPCQVIALTEQPIPCGVTSRASESSGGGEANARSSSLFDPPAISGDGRYVAFTSDASNLVADDTNIWSDVFVHDRQARTTMRVSVSSDGTQADHSSFHPTISGDGRFVAFASVASNLVADDTNGEADVFVHDLLLRTTTRVTLGADGSQATGSSFSPAISGDGRSVAFMSGASNLVDDDTNGWPDVFVHDRETGETSRVSVASDGTEVSDMFRSGYPPAPSISADGRFVAFHSYASDLVLDDTNGSDDIFVHDRDTGETIRVSVGTDGTQGDGHSYRPAISADGRYVAFPSEATDLVESGTSGVQVFVHDRQTGETSLASAAPDGSQATGGKGVRPTLSADGRHVSFVSPAVNLVAGDTNGADDVFVLDRQTGRMSRVSVGTTGTEADGSSGPPSISWDGHLVVFSSGASNLISDDTNEVADVFVHNDELIPPTLY